MKRTLVVMILLSVLPAVTSCAPAGPGYESYQQASTQLSSPTFGVSGSGTSAVGGVNYVFANSSGSIAASGNEVTATFPDPYLPLALNSYEGTYSGQMSTGSCSLGILLATVTGSSGGSVSTNLSATGCTDQAVINVYLDTTQVYDNGGVDGGSLAVFPLTVDLAPKVSLQATGNTLASGSGTTESSPGVYTLGTDNSLVVTFSKGLSASSLNASLSGCSATLGAGTLVSSSSGNTAAWTLGNLGGISSGNTCTLSVAGVQDAQGNPEDPADSNVSMTITFH